MLFLFIHKFKVEILINKKYYNTIKYEFLRKFYNVINVLIEKKNETIW